MARVKRGVTSKAKHKKVLKLVKGHRGGRSTLIKQAKESLLHAGQYAFAGRKQRKRDMRKLWITQINIALRQDGLTYSKFMNALKNKDIKIDRKILAEMAVNEPSAFKEIISQAKT
ncbi:MAG: 50S ribosomal protein L20 [Candidatus Daviesbacteria bacterium GW2011_GWA2_38_24]|uniref:Large ribosomal subunit protein bL20 n=1 Tax=Candidatus Daviesbacteria bacterium GW2011_GWA2_38_24 TaxID=1618422 RepID=A0A0G0JQ98_9BACT|nr:MAG: 50S ribosomal protein L20 [Candidatus Daviesbacteria bacterium GW2011_GWA2_38_24]